MAQMTSKQAAGMFVAGLATGAVLALLYAPKSGEQTRKDISRFSRRTVEKLDDLQRDVRGQVAGWTEDAKRYVQDGKSRIEKLMRSA